MSRCPLCGRKDCCGGYYQEVQDVLADALGSVLSLMDESSGVVGYHMNGEVATWEELGIREEECKPRNARIVAGDVTECADYEDEIKPYLGQGVDVRDV